MTIFGFTLWNRDTKQHIRDGQRRIGDALHGLADDLEAVRRINAARMGLIGPDGNGKAAPVAALPAAKAGKKGGGK